MSAARPAAVPPRERHWRSTLFQGYVVAAALGFGMLSLLARRKNHFALDLAMIRAVQRFDTPLGRLLMQAASFPGYPPQATVLSALLPIALYRKSMKWEAVTAAVSAAGIGVVGLLIKLLINRPRPDPDIIKVRRLLDGGLQSFPAGHVQTYVPIFGFIAFLSASIIESSWQRNVALGTSLTMITLVGPSRIHAGEHWPSDVLGGYFFGSLWLWLTVQFYRWGRARFRAYGAARRNTAVRETIRTEDNDAKVDEIERTKCYGNYECSDTHTIIR
jgi:membrane-associated phospholipid phosphatase